jgi:uncharacterized protein
MRVVKGLLLGAVVSILLVMGLFATLQRKLIYYPERISVDEILVAPGGLDREIFFKASDGLRINALYRPPKSGRPTILFLHGNAGTLQLWKEMHQDLTKLDVGVLTIDYRGFGKSEGSPSEQGLYADARGALAFLENEGIPVKDIIVFGKSIGTGPAVQMAIEKSLRGVILESPYSSIAAVARWLVKIPLDFLVKDKFESINKIAKINTHLLVIIAEADRLIPPQDSRLLFSKANEPKELLSIPKAVHNNIQLVGGNRYWQALRNWINGADNG